MRLAETLCLVAATISMAASASDIAEPGLGDVLQAMADGNGVLIRRDSGQPVTRGFLDDCRKDVDRHYAKLECDDLVSPWHISRVANTGERYVFVITQEGASVENRWVLEFRDNELRDITASAWPKIPIATVSKRMISATGNPKYSEEYIGMVAHSMYRVKHSNTQNAAITVHTGVPDETFETKIGELQWDGGSLKLR